MRKLVSIFCTLILLQSCASWLSKNELPPLEEPAEIVKVEAKPAIVAEVDEEPLTKFSDLNNMAPPSDRQYKRMTRQKMEEESELYGSAGSLWKMEGQSSFLFAENRHRQTGDPTSIKMEGAALRMVESKVSVIQDLMKTLEEQRIASEVETQKADAEKLRLSQIEEEKKLREERVARGEVVPDRNADMYAPEPESAQRAPAVAPVVVEKEEKIDLKDVEIIPSRIVETREDGLYRIRGQQFMTIKKKPYKVIATALVRQEDFNDAGVSSTKLLDAQYDVIHVKRTAQ